MKRIKADNARVAGLQSLRIDLNISTYYIETYHNIVRLYYHYHCLSLFSCIMSASREACGLDRE